MLGTHCINTWSVNQVYIALSSGEAEYYGAIRGASQSLGLRAMLADLGVQAGVQLMVDASAAIGIATRRGLGKIRHIELNELWLQEQVARGAHIHMQSGRQKELCGQPNETLHERAYPPDHRMHQSSGAARQASHYAICMMYA